MPTEDQMTIDERRKYLKRVWPRYRRADRPGRSRLLTEMELVTGLHRKSLLRLLNGYSLERAPRCFPRSRTYGADVAHVVALVWQSLDGICAARLTPALLPTAQHLARFGELTLTPALSAQLAQISRASVQRLLTSAARDTPRLPRRGPEAANRSARAVPVERIPWDTRVPGHCEVDLVHHCGSSTEGDYVHTLQVIDVATGWSERVAVLGRSQRAMEAAFQIVLARLPFRVRAIHSDNGPEFLNAHLVRFWAAQAVPVELSRSRPYHKNDNRFVEQKNATLVRAYLGHARLASPGQLAALNALYEQMRIYYNLFQPVLHQIGKTVSEGQVRRSWDTAATPYVRLAATEDLQAQAGAELAALYARTNPRVLREAIHAAIPRLWTLAEAEAA